MTTLLSNSSNSQLVALADIIDKGEHSLGQMWTEDLQADHKQDLSNCQQLLPGATGVFRAATPQERARRPSFVDPELLDGTAFFSSSLAVNALWHGPDNDISGEKGGAQRNWPVPVKMANHYSCLMELPLTFDGPW